MSTWWVQQRNATGGIVAEKQCNDAGQTLNTPVDGTAYCNSTRITVAGSSTGPLGVALATPRVVVNSGVKLTRSLRSTGTARLVNAATSAAFRCMCGAPPRRPST